MNIKILPWHDADLEMLRELYMNFPFPTYFGSPLVDDRMQDYRFRKVRKAADTNPESILVGTANGKIYCAAQLQRVDYLSNYFGIEVAGIANEAFVCDNASENYPAFLLQMRALRDRAEKQGIAFITASVASQAHQWIRALEENGFRYADGFRHVTASVDNDYRAFLRDDLLMRDPIESDFDEIAYSYAHMPFPNHLLYEPEFDKERVVSLYVKRYREVHAGLGKVFVAEWNGQFAGALNGIIDKDIQRELGVAVNHLSQGLIVHPRAAGKGVALALIAYRHPWYHEQEMKCGYFGSNINNLPMIWGLEKMKMRHAGIKISLMLRLKRDK